MNFGCIRLFQAKWHNCRPGLGTCFLPSGKSTASTRSAWTTLVGESSNQLTYILQCESLADLETTWAAFMNDPAWHKVRDEGERDGPIVANISSEILMPTAYSALK
jgi:hypothetical protein